MNSDMERTESDDRPDERKLGDEWRDWDGRSASGASSAGKRLFFSLTGALLFVLGGAWLFAWYLVAPRLSEWHRLLPTVALALVGLAVALLFGAYALVAVTLLARLPMPRWLSGAIRRLIARLEGGVFTLGGLLGVSRDRVAHSFVQVHNALVLINDHRTTPERILILLPRCLTREQIREANSLAARYGVGVAVVAGGELARQRIRERRPEAVIGVACERDLLSGIRDVRGRLCVLGIPNTRPHGPCKDTQIDLAELERAVQFYLQPGAAAPPAPSTTPSTTRGALGADARS